jgi:SsrA-binding protein
MNRHATASSCSPSANSGTSSRPSSKGLTIVAVRAYIAENGYAKLRIALAKGKKEFDKRQTIKEKDMRREMERG